MKRENTMMIYAGDNPKLLPELNSNKDSHFNRKDADTERIENNPLHFFDHCLVDISGKHFACIHEKCSDIYSCFRQDVLIDYLTFHKLRFHPEDKYVWCGRVYPDILKFTAPISKDELHNYRISFNQRYLGNNGSISQFLHEGTLYCSEGKLEPILNLKVFSEIGEIKTDDSIVLTIFKYSVFEGYQKVFTKVYNRKQNSLLTRREMEIIKFCQEGLSSKMIADKLMLSIHTVKNHKRHIMEKTYTHNITELIHLCLQRNWL